MENSKGQNRSSEQDLNQQNRKGGMREDATSSNADHQNIAPNRGGTTDMGSDNQQRGATGASTRGAKGSGITTKRTVTGSDYDGQVSEG
ncbi:MAG TPA: hypothetical protein VNU93_05475 [Verrucomicrobiae bacterium]|nr:hypothetical protein [Verrucomicrobiae bacterium]